MAGFELTLGANHLGNGKTAFRVWAPDRRVEVCLHHPGGLRYLPLERRPGGYHQGVLDAAPGDRYRFRLDGGDCFPDPCSRFQPEGPHGPSEIVDPRRFVWTDAGWRGVRLRGQVLYELHVGTFSPEGTYAGVIARLPELVALGVTCLELMPVNTFPGRFNWGYDGVDLFAPCAVYGPPDGLRELVNAAHRLGLAVILDVVYNHLGPDGNYLPQYSPLYFTDRYPHEWGTPINFEDSPAVRDFFIQNACHWIAEYHFDGLRIDATQNIFDRSEPHILAELSAAAHAAAPGRDILLIAESEGQDVRLVSPLPKGGCGLDAIWVDDFHHTVRVALGGSREAYLVDYRGTASELLSCVLFNALYQGQWFEWQKKERGTPLLGTPPPQVVFFLQNHDQVANHLRGLRFHQLTDLRRARALTTLFLLSPQTPLLFMGQEFFASSPFFYFADHAGELGEQVRRGREEFLSQFASVRHALSVEGHRLPSGEEAFRLSRLDWSEREKHRGPWLLHQELLRLRREDPVLSAQDRRRLEGALLGDQALVLRFFGGEGAGDRVLLLNLGPDLSYAPCPQPLLAPVPGRPWTPLLSSEEARFGGSGATFGSGEGGWRIPGASALVLSSGDFAR